MNRRMLHIIGSYANASRAHAVQPLTGGRYQCLFVVIVSERREQTFRAFYPPLPTVCCCDEQLTASDRSNEDHTHARSLHRPICQ